MISAKEAAKIRNKSSFQYGYDVPQIDFDELEQKLSVQQITEHLVSFWAEQLMKKIEILYVRVDIKLINILNL